MPTLVAAALLSSSSSIPEAFRFQASERGSSLALDLPGASYTYEELDLASNRLANQLLARLGQGQENVGVWSTSAHSLAAIMGVWKSGKCAVVLTPAFSIEKNRYLLRESGARLLLAEMEEAGPAGEIAAGTQAEIAAMLPTGSSFNPGIEAAPEDPALIIYTSGSIGEPKGVVLSHEYLLHMARFNSAAMGLTPADRLLLYHSLQTLAGVNTAANALVTGSSLHYFDLAGQGVMALPGFLEQHRITILLWIPTTFRSVAALNPSKEQFRTIRVSRFSGEPLTRADVQACVRLMTPGCVLTNTFASTEAGLICRAEFDLNTPPHGELMPAGYPVDGVEISLLDGLGRTVPDGQPGEIVVRGRYLSLGYWARPDLTSASFREEDGLRSFHTGDLGMWMPNGMLVCLGRKDKQVKVRGNRVEVQEVEDAIAQLTGVISAAVVARLTPQRGHQLIAYVVPSPGRKPTAPLLRKALAARLQSYMIPSIFVFMERLPLTHTGKVDRQALPDPVHGRAVDYAEPRTLTEKRLAACFAQVLAWDEIGIDDDFFASGGDSLLTAQLAVLIQERFGLEVDLGVLMRAPTVRLLADWMLSVSPETGMPVFQPGGTGRPFFCVQAEPVFRSLAGHLAPDRPFYGLSSNMVLRLKPPYKLGDLAALYTAMIRQVDPVGPYIIGGWCHAGLVAYEVARQLLAGGSQVELLVLFDAEPYTQTSALSQMRRIWAKILFHAGQIYALSGTHRFHYSVEQAKGLAITWKGYLWRALYRLRALSGWTILPEKDNWQRIVSLAVRGYQPSVYVGRLLVVRNGVRPVEQFVDEQLGWQAYAPNLEVLVADGDHSTMFMEPNVTRLGEQLRARLPV